MMIMQVSLDDRISRSISNFVNGIGQNAGTWIVIGVVAVVLITILITRKGK